MTIFILRRLPHAPASSGLTPTPLDADCFETYELRDKMRGSLVSASADIGSHTGVRKIGLEAR